MTSEPAPHPTSADAGTDTSTGSTGSAETTGYAAAVVELEQILSELERDDVDVDVLAERVQRAAVLIRLCRDRIAAARLDVRQIIADLDGIDAIDPIDPIDATDETSGTEQRP